MFLRFHSGFVTMIIFSVEFLFPLERTRLNSVNKLCFLIAIVFEWRSRVSHCCEPSFWDILIDKDYMSFMFRASEVRESIDQSDSR